MSEFSSYEVVRRADAKEGEPTHTIYGITSMGVRVVIDRLHLMNHDREVARLQSELAAADRQIKDREAEAAQIRRAYLHEKSLVAAANERAEKAEEYLRIEVKLVEQLKNQVVKLKKGIRRRQEQADSLREHINRSVKGKMSRREALRSTPNEEAK